MDEKANSQDIRSTIAESAFHSLVTELDLPNSVHNLLEKNGYKNVGEVVFQMKTDEQAILSIRGIGPKILEQIGVAIEQYEPSEKETVKVKSPSYNPPVPSLADYYKPHLGNNVEPEENAPEEESEKSPVYNSPVPSLADYYDPDEVITTVNPMKASAITVIEKPSIPKQKKDKKKTKKVVTAKNEKKKKKKEKKEKKGKPKKQAHKTKPKKKKTKPKVKKKKSAKKSKGKKKKK